MLHPICRSSCWRNTIKARACACGREEELTDRSHAAFLLTLPTAANPVPKSCAAVDLLAPYPIDVRKSCCRMTFLCMERTLERLTASHLYSTK